MAGIPGAGKSTFVARERSAGRLSKQAFVVNPDAVMEMPAAYVADVNAHGPAAAFARWEMPARTFAHALLDEAREKASMPFRTRPAPGMTTLRLCVSSNQMGTRSGSGTSNVPSMLLQSGLPSERRRPVGTHRW